MYFLKLINGKKLFIHQTYAMDFCTGDAADVISGLIVLGSDWFDTNFSITG